MTGAPGADTADGPHSDPAASSVPWVAIGAGVVLVLAVIVVVLVVVRRRQGAPSGGGS